MTKLDKTIEYTLTGPVKWARVSEFNRDMDGYECSFRGFDGAHTLEVGQDMGDFQSLKAAGFSGQPKMHEEGIYVKLKRKHTDQYGGGAPVVVDADGKPWDTEEMGLIGNGSIVEVDIELYPTRMANGSRLKKVKVIDLVKYERPEEDQPPEA